MAYNGLLNVVRTASMLAGVIILLSTTNTSKCEENKSLQPSTSLMMKRESYVKNAVFGSLYVNGKFVCYTLENREKMIPTGTYRILRHSKGFTLTGIKGRSQINIEIGNYPFESLGCIFVGTGRTATGLTGSKIALLRLIRLVPFPAQIEIS